MINDFDKALELLERRPVAEEYRMLPVIYSMSVSLDGFIAGPGGDIGWSGPDAEQASSKPVTSPHTCADAACIRTCWSGRPPSRPCPRGGTGVRPDLAADPESGVLAHADIGDGHRAPGHRRLATEVGRLRDQPGEGVVSLGGAGPAADTIAEDLIDEYHQFVYPVILGSATTYFPPLATPLHLRLTESQTLSSRVVYLRYQRIR